MRVRTMRRPGDPPDKEGNLAYRQEIVCPTKDEAPVAISIPATVMSPYDRSVKATVLVATEHSLIAQSKTSAKVVWPTVRYQNRLYAQTQTRRCPTRRSVARIDRFTYRWVLNELRFTYLKTQPYACVETHHDRP